MRLVPTAVAALALCAVLAGCGGFSTGTVSYETAAVKPSPTTANGSATKKTCTPPEVPGVIDGEDKCLMVTQICKPSADAQYKQFGFTCQQEKGRWVLRMK